RVLRTADSVTPGLPAWQVLASLAAFASVYAILLAIWLVVLRETVRKGPDVAGAAPTVGYIPSSPGAGPVSAAQDGGSRQGAEAPGRAGHGTAWPAGTEAAGSGTGEAGE
ncbi:MAG: cytochrome ubiquinol oxidase subunit I, partial [Planctomycetota bacterium]|nr:cytochrome ubiquinol oxidase subunit I [Planctomycetota bacterium]